MNLKFKAFAFHFLISLTVVATGLGIVYGLWYRPPFATVENVFKITLILAAVDVVIGPFLTFVVYNPEKKSLKFDLALIGILQLAALGYGMATLHAARPVYAVYADGKFSTVTREDYESIEMSKVPKDSPWMKFPAWGPAWIGAQMHDNLTADDTHMIGISQKMGGGLRLMPRFYTDYDNVAAQAITRAKRASELDFVTPPKPIAKGDTALRLPTKDELHQMQLGLQKFGKPLDQLMLLPLNGSRGRAIVVLEDKTGAILGTLSYTPFW